MRLESLEKEYYKTKCERALQNHTIDAHILEHAANKEIQILKTSYHDQLLAKEREKEVNSGKIPIIFFFY